jgi:hypothetical protein
MTNNKKNMMAQSRYIGFYNLLWLVANDLILGFTIYRGITANQSRCNELFGTWVKVLYPLKVNANRSLSHLI